MRENEFASSTEGAEGKHVGKDKAAPPYTEFTDQPVRLYCPGYKCDDTGVKTAEGQTVCLHPILPEAVFVNADDGTVSLKTAYYTHGSWRSATLPCETLASPTGVLKLAGGGVAVTAENARLLSAYLIKMYHANEELLPRLGSLDRLGWLGPRADLFMPYSETIYFAAESQFGEQFRAVERCGEVENWSAAAAPVWNGSLPARLALDASFASVLLTPLELQPFFVHLWGRTGLGKTVTLQLAASVWGDPHPGKLISTFNATGVGLEYTAAFFHDLPMCVDELQILTGAGSAELQQTLYTLSEGVGRTRGAKDGGLRRLPTWRNIFITTGEMPITGARMNGGARNRSIELELTEPITNDFASLTEALYNNHGQPGYLFVQFFIRYRDKMRGLWQGHLKELASRGVTGKQAGAMAVLLLADDLVSHLFFDRIQKTEPLEYDTAAELLLKESQVCAEASAVEYLFDTIAANPAKFSADKTRGQPYEIWGKPVAEYTAVIGSVFDKLLEEAGFNPRAVLSYANRRGLLQTEGAHLKKKVRFAGAPVRCVVIKNE